MSPDYEKMAALMASNNIFNSAAELHGLISGQLSSGMDPVQLDLIAQALELEENFSSVMEQLIGRLAKEVSAQIVDGEFSFQPLLPDDDEELSLRVYALGAWCEGFSMGFGSGFSRGDQAMLNETREVITDFAKIAEIETNIPGDEELEQGEESYMELVEYVRMAVTTVFNQNNASEQYDNEIH